MDRGNPSPDLRDPDGTRNDMGALYRNQGDTATDLATWSGVKRMFR